MQETLEQILTDDGEVGRRLRLAARNAVREHKRLGHPIAVWQDGKVVWIPAEEIVVPDEEPEKR